MPKVTVILSEEEAELLGQAARESSKDLGEILKEAGLMYAEVILDPLGNEPFGRPVSDPESVAWIGQGGHGYFCPECGHRLNWIEDKVEVRGWHECPNCGFGRPTVQKQHEGE